MARVKLERSKKCERRGCRKVFTPGRGEGGQAWEKRKYCSHACYQRAMRGVAWKVRAVRTCPICKRKFRREREDHTVFTCGDPECGRQYRLLGDKKRSETMRRQYASGERKPPGQFERMLYPYLVRRGWVYRLAWHDEFGGIELDFALLEERLNVELDGDDHKLARRRRLDAARDAELTRRGWKILRIPNGEVADSPERVARKIQRWKSRQR